MFRKKFIYIGVILFSISIIFFNKLESKKIYIPYKNKCGQVNNELIFITLKQLAKIKKLHNIYLKEKLYKNKEFYLSMGYKIFPKNVLFKYNLNYNDFTYVENNKVHNIFNRNFYEMKIEISENPLEYTGFLFNYTNTSCRGLSTRYSLFFNNGSKVYHQENPYKYIRKIEDNWYFMIETTMNTNSNYFDNIFISRENNKKWEYITPPLKELCLPFNKKK